MSDNAQQKQPQPENKASLSKSQTLHESAPNPYQFQIEQCADYIKVIEEEQKFADLEIKIQNQQREKELKLKEAEKEKAEEAQKQLEGSQQLNNSASVTVPEQQSELTPEQQEKRQLEVQQQEQRIKEQKQLQLQKQRAIEQEREAEKKKRETLLQILNKRIELLSLGEELAFLSKSRLNNLEKVFQHYCSYIFKAGKHITFDRIEYEKSHMILERLFLFIQDFKMNVIYVNSEPKELIPKNQIVLIFKKSSSNSHDLDFSEFLSLLERFAVLHYDSEQNYEERKRKIEEQKLKVKRINMLREQKKQQKQKALEQEKKAAEEEAIKQALLLKQQQQEEEKENSKQNNDSEAEGNSESHREKSVKKKREKKEKKDKKKKKKKKGAASEMDESELNDSVANDLVKDENADGQNEEFQILNKFKEQKASVDPQEKKKKQIQLCTFTRQEKIQVFYRLLELDDLQSLEAKFRPFEKEPYKFKKPKEENHFLSNQSSMNKLRQSEMKNVIRLGELKDKVRDRKNQQQKLNMSQSISDERYVEKKTKSFKRYMDRALGIKSNEEDEDAKNQRLRYPYKRKDEGVHLSLEMLNQASMDTLRLLKSPKRYLVPEKQDQIYLNEYGGFDKRMRSSSTMLSSNSPRGSVDMLKKLKKRTEQVEQAEMQREENKLNRFAMQMYKNQNYLKRMAEKR